MDEGEQRARRPRPAVALGFALAGLAASWNPLAAPFGILVGIVAAVLAVRSLRSGAGQRVSAAALGCAVLAVVASAVILLLTAGSVGTEFSGERVVQSRSAADVDRVLGEAAERTRAEREAAARELGLHSGPAVDGGAARSAPRPGRKSPGGDAQ